MKIKEIYPYIDRWENIIVYSGENILFDGMVSSLQTGIKEEDCENILYNPDMEKILEKEIYEISHEENKIRIDVMETETKINNSKILKEKVDKWVIDYPETTAILMDQTNGKMKTISFMYSADVDRIFGEYKIISIDITEQTHTIIINCWIDD